jgi:branched-chain amino acid aminotransferase
MINNWILNHQIIPFSEKEVEKLFPNNYAYEVIRLINGTPLFLDFHYKRLLKTCANQHQYSIPSKEILQNEIALLTKRNKLKNINVKIIINEEYRAVLAIPSVYPKPKDYLRGVKCNLLFEERENPEIKVFQAELRKKVDKRKQEEGVFESVLVNREGFITEGSKSNIFFIKDEELYTAPNQLVLSGITRQKVIEICEEHSYQVNFDSVHYQEIAQFNSAFICGTSPGVLPIRAIDDMSFQAANPILQKIHKAYHNYLVE